jgi:Putative beta-lactamase-inhibitor-like, PepSY-like
LEICWANNKFQLIFLKRERMKNIFLLLGFSLMAGFSANAQKSKKTTTAKVKVPETVDASFKGTFATADKNKWDKTYTGNYVAVFTNADSLSQTAEYNEEGVLLKTKTVYNTTALPEVITTALQGKYAESKVLDAVKIEIPGVAPYYKVKLETPTSAKKELYISEEGVVTH